MSPQRNFFRDLPGTRFPPVEQRITWKDAALYALSVGIGQNLSDPREYRFAYEKGMAALPTMPAILANSPAWLLSPETGLRPADILHGEESIELHGDVPIEGIVRGETVVADVLDKGEGKDALVFTTKSIIEKSSGRPIATIRSTIVCRGKGGFGGKRGSASMPHQLPPRPADMVWEFQTQRHSALLYRLCGDENPLHVDTDIARAAGLPRPILHGLCTFGIIGYGLLRNVCDYEPSRLLAMTARFSGPIFPGETIRIHIWREDDESVGFRCHVVGRDEAVVDNGLAKVSQT